MKARSPVLGYNHNVRYAGRLWHVQTEDSGANNPHVFTHLFHDGTILATKRLDYDPLCEVPTVQRLMQSQHKALLRELKAGVFDEKIGKFFGQPVVRDAEEQTDPNAKPAILELEADAAGVDEQLSGPPTDPAMARPPAETRPTMPQPPAMPSRPKISAPPPPLATPLGSRTNLPPLRTASSPTPSRTAIPPPPPPAASSSTNVSRPAIPPPPPPRGAPPAARTTGTAHPPRVAAGGIGSRRASVTPPAGVTTRPTAEGVVVARPAVIIGGDSSARREPQAPRASGNAVQSKRWQQPSGAAPATEPPKPAPNSDNIFGGDLISEKSLDEVILAYLSEDLNEK